jgi:sensor histidine kinase regulating citrate/malate metabolism
MSRALQKREVGNLDGTPEKRLYWSIISDYNLETGICELIDNAIDLWMTNLQRSKLNIELDLDADRQLIRLKDNAGGVKSSNLRLLVAPGASQNNRDARTIGIFGVGSKRAVIALAESVSIKGTSKNSVAH